MRTTIRMSDDLYREAKARAAREGRPVAAVIEDAVRVFVSRPADRTAELQPLPVFGGSGTLPGVDLTDRRRLLDVMDESTPIDALR